MIRKVGLILMAILRMILDQQKEGKQINGKEKCNQNLLCHMVQNQKRQEIIRLFK